MLKRIVKKLQEDPAKLGEWAIALQMKLSAGKHVMHVGTKNPNFKYKLIGFELAVVD